MFIKMYIYLFLLIFSVQVESFDIKNNLTEQFKAYEEIKCKSKNVEDDNLLKQANNISKRRNENNNQYHSGCYENCGLLRFGIVQKIIYIQNNDAEDVSFSSACVRCGLCLAIADKINKTLIDVHDDMPPDRWLNDIEIHVLLGIICNESFISYRLREINGDRYIGENYPGSILIESTANQLWEEKLREKCNELIEDIGTAKLYNYWKEWYAGYDKNFRNILCHGNVGILRECRSFKDIRELSALNEVKENEEKEPDYGIKINAKFECTYD